MKSEDLQVIEKVAEDVSLYHWSLLDPASKNYRAIEFPIEAEDHINDFYSEILPGLIIVVGAYRSRFYYEEENYTWEKKCYAAIVSNLTGGVNGITFITNEDVEDLNRQFKRSITLNLGLHKKAQENIINYLYDSVNRQVSGADTLITKFLEKFKTESQ